MNKITNSTIETIMSHKSVRKYKPECPSDEVIKTIARAGQQAAFAYQIYSFILSRNGNFAFKAPLLFTICVDVYKFELIMKKRNWELGQNDVSLLLFGIQDAALAVQNMTLAAESLGLGTCQLGIAPYNAAKIQKKYNLPEKVFPLVQLAVGYPDEVEPVRPRYPLEYVLFEENYPDLSDEQIENAIEKMDKGYMDQDYYKKANYMIELPETRKETYNFDTYGWTEHISRKCGLWWESSEQIKKQMKICGFNIDE